MTYSNEDTYEGEWKGGMRHGYGVYTNVDGSKYSYFSYFFLGMQVIGRMINKMELEKKFGKIALLIEVNFLMELKTGKGQLNSEMEIFSRGSLKII